ncbi:myosin-10 [Drosophila tropicalis]|uniref:myosin-10 n=1 Tax=Drosophila tropicalis TaxID=46794 RepID=UPI0035ABD399
MNMNTPGVSLFQGGETLKINSTLDRLEEEEALQDQKRREEELGNLLENAFDDLDDDDSTVDSTTNFHSDLLPEQPLPTLPSHHVEHQIKNYDSAQHNIRPASEMEIHKLKMMLESKTHELNNVNKVASEAHKKIDEYQKRLTIAQAELDRALREKQNTHELLVEAKERCSNQDNNLEKLRGDKKSLELENTRLVGQLETAQSMLGDVQRKYDMVERDLHKREERHADIRIKQMEEQQRAKLELLQQQLCSVTDQLDKTKQDLEQMQTRYQALQANHETMVLEKAARINELNGALDVAQRRCNQLSSKPNFEAESIRQKQCIAELHSQVATMEKTIATLNERVNGTTAELDLMDTLLQQHHTEDITTGRLSQGQDSRLVGSTPLNPIDRIGHIKQELYRALGNLKNKREEVRRLEKQVEERNQELRQQREQENHSLVQLATLKEEKARLENRLKLMHEELSEAHNKSLNKSRLQSELETLTNERDALKQQARQIDEQLKNVEVDLEELKQEHDSLKRNYEQLNQENRQLRTRTSDNTRMELERHKILLKNAQGEVERLKKLYAEISNDKESLNYQLRKLQESDNLKELQDLRQQLASLQRGMQLAEVKSEELSKILDTERLCHERELQTLREKLDREKREEAKAAAKESSDKCSRCIEHLAEITKVEIQMLKLQNVNTMQAKELKDLSLELEQSKALQNELEEKIELSIKQERMINELKIKARQFEEYINQQAAEISEKKQSSPKTQTSVSSPGLEFEPISPDLTQERIKRIEQRVRDEMAKLFANELKRFTTRLHQTEEKSLCLQREYNLLCGELQQRQTEVELLKQTILAERENIEELLEAKESKQKAMLQKCRTELQAKNQRIAELLRELDEQHASIGSERQSMKTVMAQWEAQKQSVDQVEQHWREQLKLLQSTHEEAMRAAQQRYQSAKRTAHNYKLYAEDKEAHMKREYERIKHEYELSLAKIELTMSQRLERKIREPPQRDKENQPSNNNKNR